MQPSPQGDQANDGFLRLLRWYAGYHEPLLIIALCGRGSYAAGAEETEDEPVTSVKDLLSQ